MNIKTLTPEDTIKEIKMANIKIANMLIKSFDFICLQEAHFFGNYSQTKEITNLTSLDYYKELILHKSHLTKNSGFDLGISVISKYKIISFKKYIVKNPNLKIKKDNNIWISHDKGIIAVEVSIPNLGIINILSCHLLPFHRFGFNSEDYIIKEAWKEVDNIINAYNDKLTIIGGDFNENNIPQLLPQCFNNGFQSVKTDKPTYGNNYYDHLIFSKHFRILKCGILDYYKISDHYPVYVEFEH